MKATFNMDHSLVFRVETGNDTQSLYRNDVLIAKAKNHVDNSQTLFAAVKDCINKAVIKVEKGLKEQAKAKYNATMNDARVKYEFCQLQSVNTERTELFNFLLYFCRFIENSFYSQIINSPNINIDCN